MASFDDRMLAVARVYAEAMLGLAEKRGEAESLNEELAQVARLYARDPGFRDFVASPLIDVEEREESLERAFRGRASELLVDSLQILNRKGRMSLLPAVAEVFRRLYREHLRQVEVDVTSAIALSDDQRRRLQEAIRRRTGRDAILSESVDPSLLGGLVVRLEDRKIDASVATQLERLSETLLSRASREIGSAGYVEREG